MPSFWHTHLQGLLLLHTSHGQQGVIGKGLAVEHHVRVLSRAACKCMYGTQVQLPAWLLLLLLLLLFSSTPLLHALRYCCTEPCLPARDGNLLLVLWTPGAAGQGLTLAGLHEGLHIVGGRVGTHLKEVGLACKHKHIR